MTVAWLLADRAATSRGPTFAAHPDVPMKLEEHRRGRSALAELDLCAGPAVSSCLAVGHAEAGRSGRLQRLIRCLPEKRQTRMGCGLPTASGNRNRAEPS